MRTLCACVCVHSVNVREFNAFTSTLPATIAASTTRYRNFAIIVKMAIHSKYKPIFRVYNIKDARLHVVHVICSTIHVYSSILCLGAISFTD